MIQHRDPVGQRHDCAHHMLDKNDGRAALAYLADQRDGLVDLARCQAREHFVEQHQARPQCQRARQFQELALVQVEVVGQVMRLVVQAGEFQPLPSLLRCLRVVERGAAEHRDKRDVLQHRQMCERPGNLIGAGNAGLRNSVRGQTGQLTAFQKYFTAACRVVAANDVDKS